MVVEGPCPVITMVSFGSIETIFIDFKRSKSPPGRSVRPTELGGYPGKGEDGQDFRVKAGGTRSVTGGEWARNNEVWMDKPCSSPS